MARTIRLLTITLKRLYLAPANLVTYILAEFQQNRFTRGAATAVFEMRHLSYEFLFCLKTTGMQRGYNFVPEKMFSGIKSDLFSFCSIPGGKYRIAMTRSLLEMKSLCDVISLKVEQPITLNFACLLVSSVPLLVANLKSIR